mmetsp:Transcript_1831/g.2901  ORF Transcript_1831/g.2901 Transcript_1831/m.2901 type:complete len:612 (+) Transcript_1831:86-1921(+)
MSSAPNQSGKADVAPKFRTESPCPQVTESPSKSGVLSTTKSWCSSPFSNLVALSPDGNSLSFSLVDFSPGVSFSSPRLKFQNDHSSPQSSSRIQRDQYSLFSPSLFSPFNKSLKPHKMDKLLESDFLDTDSILESSATDGEGLFMPKFQQVDSQRGNSSQGIFPHLTGPTDATKTHRMDLDTVSEQSFDDSLLGEDMHLRLGSSPGDGGASKTGGLLGTSSLELSPSLRPLLTQSNISSVLPPHGKGTPPTALPPPPASKTASTKNSQITPGKKGHLKFSSPAVLSKAKQPANMSPMDTKSRCNCKKSKCLKLYCECFAALRYCGACNCIDCNNCKEHDKVRSEAIQATKERNPTAFHSKVNEKKGHLAGCNCKRSQCLKKYCECFEGAVYCGTNCKCQSCENYSGSTKLIDARNALREKFERAIQKSDPGSVGAASHEKNPTTVTPSSANTPFKARSRRCTPGPGSAPAGERGGKLRKDLQGSRNQGSGPSTDSPTSGSHITSTSPGQSEEPPVSENSPISSTASTVPEEELVGDSCESEESSPPPLKKRRVSFEDSREPRYPFFGPKYPRTTKLTALRCLEYLDGPNLFAVSLVNRLWNQAAMDDALWE